MKSELKSRVERLHQAVEAAGGRYVVAKVAGMPPATLGNYLAGRDMKAQAMVDLAQATGVNLEWLATGRGPMRDAADLPLRYVDFENLATGLEMAEQLAPEAPPEARISTALLAAQRLRKQQAAGEASPLDVKLLGSCLGMIETLFGRDRPVIRRLRPAVGAYEIMIADPPGPDEPKPASEADKND